MIFFNEMFMYNFCYVNFSVFDEEIYEVCWVVVIYDCIMSFFDGYNIKVGE